MINRHISRDFMRTFIGMSTVGRKKPPFTLTDTALVKQDLINHLNTRLGELAGDVTYGTILPDLIMDQLDDFSRRAILDEVERVLSLDPRIVLSSPIKIIEFENGVRLEVTIDYVSFDNSETLYLDFKKQITI